MKFKKLLSAAAAALLLMAAVPGACAAQTAGGDTPVSITLLPPLDYVVVVPDKASLRYDGSAEYALGEIYAAQVTLPEDKALQVSVPSQAYYLYADPSNPGAARLRYTAGLRPGVSKDGQKINSALLAQGDRCGLFASFDPAARGLRAGTYASPGGAGDLSLIFEVVEVSQ